MKNRFQFRVWKGKENRMVYGVTYLNPLLLDPDIDPENTHNKLMQSTGLKDKNGKLIYEGDIVKAYFTDDGILKYDLMIVEWCKSSCAFVFKDYKFMNFEDFITTCFESESYEVVGNIYEDKIEQM